MRYQGAEAVDFDSVSRDYEGVRRAERPSFEVVTGGGLDARARQGVTPHFVTLLRLAVVAVVAFVAIGAVRVALTTATVGVLSSNAALQTKISAEKDLNADLMIERSVSSSASRIVRIATQNLGMVYATGLDSVDMLSEGERAAAEASGFAAAKATQDPNSEKGTNDQAVDPSAWEATVDVSQLSPETCGTNAVTLDTLK